MTTILESPGARDASTVTCEHYAATMPRVPTTNPDPLRALIDAFPPEQRADIERAATRARDAVAAEPAARQGWDQAVDDRNAALRELYALAGNAGPNALARAVEMNPSTLRSALKQLPARE